MRCSHCGQQNPDQYLYCASCGAALTAASGGTTGARTQPAPSAPQAPMHVEKRDVSYLLDDDAPRKSPVLKILLLLIVAAVGFFLWRQLKPAPATTNQVADVSKSPVASEQADPAKTQPSPEKPEATPQTTPTPPVNTPAVAAPSSESQPADAAAKPASTPESTPSDTTESSDESAEDSPSTRPEPVRTEPVRPVAKPAPKPRPATPVDPMKQAEAYLYGRGVAKDCDKAVSLLKSAADKSNVRARSTLGSMYATGHCVSRDLPTAYKYFALVLRTDPENTTASQNLQSIWQQMTPPERQAATK